MKKADREKSVRKQGGQANWFDPLFNALRESGYKIHEILDLTVPQACCALGISPRSIIKDPDIKIPSAEEVKIRKFANSRDARRYLGEIIKKRRNQNG